MTLTVKEKATLEIFNKKALIYEYVEVKSVGIGGVENTINKLQKIGAKAKKFKSSLETITSDYTMAQITDMDEARRRKARCNNL